MPLYEYVCPVCRSRFERLQPMSGAASADCPNCEAPAKRLVSMMAPAMIGNAGGAVAGSGGGCACGGNCACSA
jgi:putative FmdB family regulatory protein